MSDFNQSSPGKNKPKLLEQVRSVLRAKHYSLRTEEAYIKGELTVKSPADKL